MKIAYLSAPYSAPTQNEVYENIQTARRLSVALWKLGYAVICPHLNSMFMDGVVPYERFLEADLTILSKCDVLFAYRWRESDGATAEVRRALKLGLECVEITEEGRYEEIY